MILVTAAEMRRMDELTIGRHGTPGYTLMRRAGTGATAVLRKRFPRLKGSRVLVLAGKGNNGGDGFVIAQLLKKAGVRAEVALLAPPGEVRGDAALALRDMQKARVPITELRSRRQVEEVFKKGTKPRLLVDAVFGTGLSSTVRGLHAEALTRVNESGLPVFAVDIPSGLDSDRGVPLGIAVRAAATATFGFAKVGHVVYPGIDYVGDLSVVDIGLAAGAVSDVRPRTFLLDDSVGALLPRRAPDAHKGVAGHVLVVAGSRGHSGAALLTARAACRAGAGLTTLAGPGSLNTIYSLGAPEVMTAPLADVDGEIRFDEGHVRSLLQGKSAVVVGPGIGIHEDAEKLVRFLLDNVEVPLLLDADALTCVARHPQVLAGARGTPVLTPHPGEMARLLAGDSASVQGDRVGHARRFASEHKLVLVLKGARSVIAAPDGEAWINPTGNAGMASGGMGDALSGIVGALLAQGLSAPQAARLGVYLHGAAADRVAEARGDVGLLASDVIEALPPTVRGLRRQREAGP
jgi:NAD(P)H-hydrate epimerase